VNEQIREKLCGRALSVADIEIIREQIRLAEPANRAEIARRVCRALDWKNARGEPKLMSARVGLLRLHRAGLIELPAPRCGNGKAANWQYLGETQGRGKCDVAHRAALPRKGVYVYPLRADFRRALGVAA
jgi:hypothetical protein